MSPSSSASRCEGSDGTAGTLGAGWREAPAYTPGEITPLPAAPAAVTEERRDADREAGGGAGTSICGGPRRHHPDRGQRRVLRGRVRTTGGRQDQRPDPLVHVRHG